MSEPTRRAVLTGTLLAAGAGVAGFGVGRSSDAAKTPSGPAVTNTYGTPMAANAYGTPPMTAEVALAPAAKVPAGGGLVLTKRRVVLTKDAAGTVRGFTAVCPHQGCTVSDVDDRVIHCPCHGSTFDVRTGAVVHGPAARGLAPVPVAVRAGTVYTT